MEALCHGGGIVQALNTHVYGNETQTLVLAHGFGADQTIWHFLISFLACYFKVVVFDWVYFPNVDPKLYDPKTYSNFSAYAEDLVCLLDHLNVKKGLYLNTTAYTGGFTRPQLDALFNQIGKNFTSWVPSFAPTPIGVNDTRAITEFENSLGRMSPRIAVRVDRVVFLSDLRRILPQIIVPSSIIQSRKDFIVPKSVAFYMKKKLGGPAKVKILNTEGHFPQLTAYLLLLKVLKKLVHIT
ncbi:hypothetical protein C1H46_003518 [Malus baccata]|uniref:AB hydrolase-1 domain-containing protein n=1 Tax=Malus baccata TaxID=106549 RepID=A0A540NIE2_MALBA|nr:hypothetical protein C1H46_003518 [Malus baccata]